MTTPLPIRIINGGYIRAIILGNMHDCLLMMYSFVCESSVKKLSTVSYMQLKWNFSRTSFST